MVPKKVSAVELHVECWCVFVSHQVNINYGARNRILTMVAQGMFVDTIFDEAQQDVFNLMKRDSFGRFALKFNHDDLFGGSEASRKRFSV